MNSRRHGLEDTTNALTPCQAAHSKDSPKCALIIATSTEHPGGLVAPVLEGLTREQWQQIARHWWEAEQCETDGVSEPAVYLTPNATRFDCWEHALVDPDERVGVFP